jgi:hypothetical protein
MGRCATLLAMTLLVLFPVIGRADIGQQGGDGPPIAQRLVREGDLAVELAHAFNLGPVRTEEEAESVLASVGIAPKNGWISDYPVTPDVIGELQAVIATAADSNTLDIREDDALAAFSDVLDQLGLPPITTDGSSEYAEDTQPATNAETGAYVDSGGLADYYSRFSPPVVTYYTPPWPYYPLYSWVRYPFRYHEVFFRGFFVLRRFHCVKPVAVVRHHGSGVIIISRPVWKVVTNRVVDPATHRVVIIDPSTRSTHPAFALAPSSSTARFGTVQPVRGSNGFMERNLGEQVRKTSTRAKVVKGQPGKGTALTSEGPKFFPPLRGAKPDGDFSRAQRGNPTTLRSSRASSAPLRPRIRVLSSSTAGLPRTGMTPGSSQNPPLPGHNRDRMVSPAGRRSVQPHEQPSFSQATRNKPTGVVSTRNLSQVGRTALPRSTAVFPAYRGSGPQRAGSVGYGWGNGRPQFGVGRMGSFGARRGFGRR